MFKVVKDIKKKFFIIFLIFLFLLSVCNVSTTADEARSDLTIISVNCPDVFLEGEEVKIPIEIKNQGNKNISNGEKIGVCLQIDGNIVATNSTWNGLNTDSSCFVNISWMPTDIDSDEHLLSIVVDYDGWITESNENNNVWDKYINYQEKNTILEIISLELSKNPVVGKTVNVSASITNKGMQSNSSIDLILKSSSDGKIDNITIDQALTRDSVESYSFNWIPSKFGSQNISLDVIYKEETHDHLEKTIFVDVGELQWWNNSWHYRYFVVANGAGNLSIDIDFADLLDEIGANSQNFENKKIIIIQYNADGSIVGEVEKYLFNESAIDPLNNATGKLVWDTTNTDAEKYFCIYFDVKENKGLRSVFSETNLSILGNVSLDEYSFVQGWEITQVSPINNSYCSLDETIDISVKANAKAKNITAEFYWNNSIVDTIKLSDEDDNISWVGNYTFNNYEGNWTIKIIGIDDANYSPKIISYDFFVGMPDIELSNVSFETNYPATSPKIYIHDILNISAHIKSYNANIDDVEISVYIFDIDNNDELVFYEETTMDIYKDQENILSVYLLANQTGNFNVTIIVDPQNLIVESNEMNNQITQEITVYDLPDLEVVDISLPEKAVIETNKVVIEATVANNADIDVFDYTAVLYIEPSEQGIMTYSKERYHKIFSISNNSAKKISLIWSSSEAGEWLVGVKIIVNESKRDINIQNNRMLSSTNLFVEAVESNAPLISDVSIDPRFPEQGEAIEISSKVIDESGLDYVEIEIKNPFNSTLYIGDMVRSNGNEFKVEFKDTFENGEYTFKIKAKDLSVHSKETTLLDTFIVFEDSTDPVIFYFDVNPRIIEKYEYFSINCVASDNIEIDNVKVIINSPSGNTLRENLKLESEGKYVYKDIYSVTGKCSYYIQVEDVAGNIQTTDKQTFWITSDRNDTDNDGMPNWWEEKYNFDLENSSDADLDDDGDGFTNLREYKLGNNPKKDILIQNIAPRITDNAGYIFASIFVFVLIILLAMYSKRRKFL